MTEPLPPGPRGNWLLGCLGDFRRDMLGFYTRCAQQYGDLTGFRLGPRRLALVNHPDLTEYILTTGARQFSKLTYVLKLLLPVLGRGLLTSEGDFWLRQRRLLQRAFHRDRLVGYGATMVAYTERFLQRWHDGATVDLHAEMMQLTLEIVGKTLFDADVANEAHEVGACLEEVMHYFLGQWRSFIPLPTHWPTPANVRLRRTMKKLDAIIYRMIDQRRRSGVDQGDVLSILLQARDEDDGTGMTDLHVRDEAMTLFLAGHETTANAMSWTWYLLAQHPEVDETLLAELRAVLGDRPPTVADLPRLPYCEHIITESMRLYPPAYGFGRVALHDLSLGGYRIRGGTTVLMVPWVTQRDGRFFEEPLKFRPERWADGLAKRLPRYAYFPFGGGARQCIGKDFGMMEAQLILATIAPRYRFELVPGQVVKPLAVVTLRPEQGIRAVLRRR